MKRLLQTALFAALAIMAIGCTESKEARTNKEIKEIVKTNQAVGLAAVLVKDTNILYAHAFGLKDIQSNAPLQLTDLFRIASISKSFTATALMQLIEQEKLKLEEDMSNLVGYKVRNPLFPDTPITLRMMLSHTSSINDSQGYYTPGAVDILNPDVNEDYAKAYNQYEPGTGYEYCNLNFNMLGTILERVSGERFDKYIVHHILNPIGVEGGYEVLSLDTTKFVTLYEYDSQNNTFVPSPEAYATRKEQIDNYVFGMSTPIFSPTGGLKISPLGLAKIMQMHMHKGLTYGADGKAVQILDEHSSNLMQSKIFSPTDEGDAYGFAIRTTRQLIDGKIMKGHTGGAYGVYTAMFWQPEENWGVIIMTNGCNGRTDHNFMSIHREVAKALYDNYIKGNNQALATINF